MVNVEKKEPRFPAVKLFKYPHMFPLDIAIWERFIDYYGSFYDGFDYDVKIGTGSVPGPETPENYARMETILSKYRIDAVGHNKGTLEIIEVKPEASTVAIGQIITYVELYIRDLKPTLPIVGHIISNHIVGDMEYLTKKYGIIYTII